MNKSPNTAATASALPGIARPARRSLGGGGLRTGDGRAALWERRAPSRRPCRSDSRHKHNTLGGGVIGLILRNRRIDTQTYAATDKWFHYDQVGSVLAETNASGASVSIHHPDAFGNRMSSWETGLWGTSWAARAGWGHNTKELMADTGLVYMYQRWYNPETGAFLSKAPYPPYYEAPYGFSDNNPSRFIDPLGRDPKCQGAADMFERLHGNTVEVQQCAKRCSTDCCLTNFQALPGDTPGSFMRRCVNSCLDDLRCAEALARFNNCLRRPTAVGGMAICARHLTGCLGRSK